MCVDNNNNFSEKMIAALCLVLFQREELCTYYTMVNFDYRYEDSTYVRCTEVESIFGTIVPSNIKGVLEIE